MSMLCIKRKGTGYIGYINMFASVPMPTLFEKSDKITYLYCRFVNMSDVKQVECSIR